MVQNAAQQIYLWQDLIKSYITNVLAFRVYFILKETTQNPKQQFYTRRRKYKKKIETPTDLCRI